MPQNGIVPFLVNFELDELECALNYAFILEIGIFEHFVSFFRSVFVVALLVKRDVVERRKQIR